MISRPASVSRDEGRSRLIRCALVIVMYLVATSPLSLRWTFIQGNTDDETQETTYIYSRGWILLSSMSFTAVVLITECIVVSRYHYTYLSKGLDAGTRVDLVVLALLWSKMDVCCDSRDMRHCRNQLSSLILYHQKIRTDVKRSFCRYWSLSVDRYNPPQAMHVLPKSIGCSHISL